MKPELERRLLQGVMIVAALVPIGGGLLGVLNADDSHERYLNGLLMGLGLAFWSCVPRIETRGAVVRTLAAVVVVGGLARLSGVGQTGLSPMITFTLAMELGVTPLVALWRERVARGPGGG